jgi:hypothetical protein
MVHETNCHMIRDSAISAMPSETMHAHITGHRSRIAALEKLVIYMKSKPGVWFATLEQVTDYVKSQDQEAKK